MIATMIVIYKDSIIDESANILEYHCIEKPVKCVSDLLELNEKTIIKPIGK